MARPLLVSFVAGDNGPWRVDSVAAAVGPPLPSSTHLTIVEGGDSSTPGGLWCLRGFTSNERYVERSEREQLVDIQETLGRADATCAALIPIRKSEAWWDLTQDERRQVIEQRSAHIATGLEYLPAIARRLHHCRDMGEEFDFLTWFEFAPEHRGAFEDLVGRLRQTEEWTFVEREIDIRLTR